MQVERFLAGFFGPGNEIRWDQITGDSYRGMDSLRPWLDRFRDQQSGSALPRTTYQHETIWYIFAETAQEERIARDELIGFLGMTHAGYQGQPTHLDESDPVDSVVMAHFPWTIKIHPPKNKRKDVASLLAVRASLRHRKPRGEPLDVRPIAQVLRDIDEGIRLRQKTTLGPLLNELRARKQVSRHNLATLELLVADASDEPRAVLALARKNGLLETRRPAQATEALIRALYRIELSEFVAADNPEGALRWFSEQLRQRYVGLFRSRLGLSGHAVDTCFMLKALSDSPVGTQTADKILGESTSDSSRVWLTTLRDLTGPTEDDDLVPASLATAKEAFSKPDLDGCWSALEDVEDSAESVLLRLRCAAESGRLDWARTSLLRLGGLSDIGEHPSYGNISRLRSELQRRTASGLRSSATPESWLDWLENLAGEEAWPTAAAFAKAGVVEWDREIFSAPEGVKGLLTLLQATIGTPNEENLRDSVPYLMEVLERIENPPMELGELYDGLFFLVVTDRQPSRTIFATIGNILAQRSMVGFSPDTYSENLEYLSENIQDQGAPSNLDDLLDIAEFLLHEPCPHEDARSDFIRRVLSRAATFPRAVHPVQSDLLLEFAQITETQPDPRWEASALTHDETAEEWAHLSGCDIALYSLDEAVLHRAKKTIESRVTDVKVATFMDTGGKASLKAAAQRADIFVIATRVAKHAATEFIEIHRSASKTTVYPDGKGSSSMLRALLDLAVH